MRKKMKKLTLHRETLHFLGRVTGAASVEETICGYTCIRQCQLVYTVDNCPTNPVGGCASGQMGCPSGYYSCAGNLTC